MCCLCGLLERSCSRVYVSQDGGDIAVGGDNDYKLTQEANARVCQNKALRNHCNARSTPDPRSSKKCAENNH